MNKDLWYSTGLELYVELYLLKKKKKKKNRQEYTCHYDLLTGKNPA